MDQEVSDLSQPRPETRWCLLELPKDQLEALEAGQRFYIQEFSGAEAPGDGYAALCTANATFGVEFLENSNTILLGKVATPESASTADGEGSTEKTEKTDGRCTIFAQCRGQLIVKPEKVDVNKVRELLAPSALGQVTGGKSAELFDTAALKYEVAAGASELITVLKEGPYVEVDGKWRLLPERLENEILDCAVTVITAMGWKPEAVDGKSLLEEVQTNVRGGEASVPNLLVLEKALRSIIAKPGDKNVQPDKEAKEKSAIESQPAPLPGVLAVDKQKMNLFRALQILREPAAKVRDRFGLPPPEPKKSANKRPRLAQGAAVAAGALQVDEFAAAYRELTDTEATSEEVLKVLGNQAYVDEFEGTIHVMDVTALPRDAVARLKRLFELQSHWRPERLAALIAPALAGVKVDPWLLKNARQVFVELEPGVESRMLTKKFG